MMPMPNLLRYARTLSHLKSGQIAWLVRRRLLPPPHLVRETAVAQPRAGIALRSPVASAPVRLERGKFRFLNVAKRFAGPIDWASRDMSRLWRYNLHYFDYLLDARSIGEASDLIADWIGSNPPPSTPGWEPYPTSLRIVNWIKLALRADFSGPIPAPWVQSLDRQAHWLEQNLEYDLLGNHLLKNGKALFFAGAFLSGRNADRWLRKGLEVLTGAADEQLLADGGHYERSPMYHAIVVEDYLDVLNLLLGSPGTLPREHVEFFVAKTRAALDFLTDIVLPDGSIPLFNDSALGIAPSADALAAYGRRLIGYRAPARGGGVEVSSRAASGYFVIRHGRDMLIVDCGEVGPRYQPGHAHCDTLSFELACDGRAVIVDSGVYDYEDSELRRYVRGTRAHNTAMIDGCEQSELWGVFRAGRRACPIRARLRKTSASAARFSGSHDAFVHLPGRPIHARDIEYEAEGLWTIVDRFSGDGEHRVDTFLHIHPQFETRRIGGAVSILDAGHVVAEIEPAVPCELALETGWYCPEFGRKQRNTVIRLYRRGLLPLTLACRIRTRRASPEPQSPSRSGTALLPIGD